MRPRRAALPLALAVALSGCLASTPAPLEPAPDAVPDWTRLPVAMSTLQRALPLASFGGEPPQFLERFVGDRPAGEPTLAIGRDGTLLYPSTAFDAPAGLPRTVLFASSDEAKTWTDVTPCLADPTIPVPVAGGTLCAGRTSPYTVDPMVWGDPKTGRLFNIDLQLEASWLSWTDDGGTTWDMAPLAGGHYTRGHDHQTLFGGPPPPGVSTDGYPSALYYCVNSGSILCSRSLDGGANWQDAGTIDPQDASCESGLHGHGIVDAAGVLYLPQSSYCKNAVVYVSQDGAQTWKAVAVNRTVGADRISETDPSIAVDDQGTLYYFWLDNATLPRLAVSRDGGATWGAAWNVTLPGVTLANFPSIVAGGAGRVAFLYLGTSYAPKAPYDPDKRRAFLDDFDDHDAPWNAYIGVSLNADAEEPVIVTTTANDPADPVARGACIGRCHGVYDFLDIEIHPGTGQVVAALVDVCRDACASPGGKTEDQAGSRGAVGVQVGGARLRA